MKKTLIALLALGGMATASDLSFKTAGTASDNSGGCAGFSLTLSDNTRMNVTGEMPTAPTALQLDSIVVNMSSSMDSGTTPLVLFVVDSDYTLMAVSSTVTPTNVKNEVLTFDFSGKSDAMTNPSVNKTNSTLTSGETYYAFFLNASRYSTTTDRNYNASIGEIVPTNNGHPWADSNTVALRLTGAVYGADTKAENGILSGANGQFEEYKYDTRSAIVTVNTTMMPEPATATLSLLALAGLASRRRRH